jgi:hypothetical protein
MATSQGRLMGGNTIPKEVTVALQQELHRGETVLIMGELAQVTSKRGLSLGEVAVIVVLALSLAAGVVLLPVYFAPFIALVTGFVSRILAGSVSLLILIAGLLFVLFIGSERFAVMPRRLFVWLVRAGWRRRKYLCLTDKRVLLIDNMGERSVTTIGPRADVTGMHSDNNRLTFTIGSAKFTVETVKGLPEIMG